MSPRIALVVVLLGCGAGAPRQAERAARDRDYAAAEQAYADGDLVTAKRLFGQVAADAVDADARALAQYRLARIAEKLGDARAATAGFAEVAEGPSRERGALAAYALAVKALDAGDVAPMRALVDAAPGTVAADKAVRVLRERAQDPAATIAWLEGVALRHARSDVADNALWWAADLRLNALGDVAGAKRLLAQIAQTWPQGAMVDDALWLLALLYRRQGQWGDAIATYDALAHIQPGKSFMVGSYRSRRLDDALLARADVYMHGLKDCAAAAQAYRALLDAFESSVLRDDALFGLIQAQRCQGVDPARAVARLRAAHPDSRLLRQIDTPVAPDAARLEPGPLAP